MEILVFKTTVENMKHVRRLYSLLKSIHGVLKWTIDTEDVDKVLRVEVVSVAPRNIEMTLQSAGYYCKELED
jgi:hypothetical protein